MNDNDPPSVFDPASVPMKNLAVFTLNPAITLQSLLRRNAQILSWRVVPGGLLEIDVQGAPTDIFIPTHCTVRVTPLELVEKMLPPGNTILQSWLTSNGSIAYVFEGIDAPESPDGTLPQMRLMVGESSYGVRESWIEAEPPSGHISPDDALLAKLRDLVNRNDGIGGAA